MSKMLELKYLNVFIHSATTADYWLCVASALCWRKSWTHKLNPGNGGSSPLPLFLKCKFGSPFPQLEPF